MALKMNQTVFAQELVLKYESWKVLREILPYEFFVIHAAIQPRNSFPEQVFNPAVSTYENCKRPRRNHRSKRENCFAIFILVCNFHISLQFSYQFAILTSRLEDFLRTRIHTDSHVIMNLNSYSTSATVLVEETKKN